jgi:hypothetical protein
MYFLQVNREKLYLRYSKGHYGPYVKNLSHLLIKMECHLISGYANGGDQLFKDISLVPGATREADIFFSAKIGYFISYKQSYRAI